MNRLLAALALLLSLTTLAFAENWPMWRGPRLDGSSLEKDVPLKWSEGENIAWKTAIPGVGYSSPIVVGDRVFLTSCLIKEQARVLYCLDRQDGHIAWQRELFRCPLEPVHPRNSRAIFFNDTATTEIYTSFLRLRPRT